MDKEHVRNGARSTTLEVESAFHTHRLSSPELLITQDFAPEWFEDALHEARIGKDYGSRRREILFAVCFAESYLVEWVRDEVLKKDFDKFNKYFPPGQKMGVKDKWKKIIKRLKEDNLVPGGLDYSKAYWNDFAELVDYRDGLVHARTGRPEKAALADKEKPFPKKKALEELSPGWATNLVVELLRHLHEAVDTPAPGYLKAP